MGCLFLLIITMNIQLSKENRQHLITERNAKIATFLAPVFITSLLGLVFIVFVSSWIVKLIAFITSFSLIFHFYKTLFPSNIFKDLRSNKKEVSIVKVTDKINQTNYGYTANPLVDLTSQATHTYYKIKFENSSAIEVEKSFYSTVSVGDSIKIERALYSNTLLEVHLC